ncbi:MAG: exodeoxyribonuclease III [Deltaproteobacteria bacterium CG_4_10_14_0_2_um_filter_43_8]|nr:MAG: exodeoxyribonuclease III [Deltaproteobacteria bacterium CG11_big_fil_rev_8_21_14_0_20_42_23]PJA18795.1 MAG: exodeoxyribonuclease III [Deltaproteobacteria bacterium CG_4_10_14_0_2_um_filter_43_8]PJC63326.1 MAG: exodeoxyribonuclease III [Deltaproteobacteria bacterium CG_4_9_14_0_2_um_filter_42_21]
MKLISWNVNGIRAVLRKNFHDFMNTHQPDILCLQETKANKEQVDIDYEEYHHYWNSGKRPGYSGTLLLTKQKPLEVHFGMNLPEHDEEGRVITALYKDFILVNVYTPNSGDKLQRLGYRQVWDKVFVEYLDALQKKKPVILCGDLNVARNEIDLARPDQNHNSAGFTDEEREGVERLFAAGFLDTFREFHPDEPDHYTWWSYRTAARKRNVGWRIDYFCVSAALKTGLKAADIHCDVLGSDHCPVGLTLNV